MEAASAFASTTYLPYTQFPLCFLLVVGNTEKVLDGGPLHVLGYGYVRV